MPQRTKSPPSLPSKEDILAFVRESPRPVGRREIARAFRIKGSQLRIEFKELLRELEDEGLIERHGGARVAAPGRLPPVTVIEVTGTDEDGDLIGRPVVWHGAGAPPRVYVAPERRGAPAIEAGARVLAKLSRGASGDYEARPIRVIAGRPREIIGVFTPAAGGGWLRSTDRRHRRDFFVAAEEAAGVKTGDLVRAEVAGVPRRGEARARITARLGHAEDPGAISLIAVHSHDIPVEFPPEALRQAQEAQPCPLGARTDLREVPLVTIDGPDARDFDDAVWAEPDPAPDNPGGFRLIVAIADVAHYVGAGSALDRAAYTRGNSVYFPDRVVPMLPEALSNDLCSLKPGEARACIAARMRIDKHGNKLGQRFERGLMRSAARLTYDAVEAAYRGNPDPELRPLMETVIAPLYGAYRALLAARKRRGTLDLDLPEPKVVFAPDGSIARITPAPRFESHKLIEEFMIAANVAAAETLEEARQPVMYRIHDRPDPEKLDSLRDFLEGIGYRLAKGHVIRPQVFTGILEQARKRGDIHLVSELVLRTQSQAQYAPDNIGHFGLGLRRYCHFTSPIRRYADLLVHRALISGLRLGRDGLHPDDGKKFPDFGDHISNTERRAVAAERDARDRYTVAYLEDKLGTIFTGRITGVTHFGLFVRLDDNFAEGLVPRRTLADDFYLHDESRHALVGRRWGRTYTLGDPAAVRLTEADAVTGGLVFELVQFAEEEAGARPAPRPVPPPRRGAKKPVPRGARKPVRRGKRKAGKRRRTR